MAVDQVLALVRDNTDHRTLGFLDDLGVLVLKLILALDNVEG
jgi:K+-transporting ATPase c subunit